MARVGFCVHGFAGDQRDYFPFHFVDDPDQNDPASDARIVSLPFDKSFEFIHRIRGMRISVNISCLDPLVDPPVTRTAAWGQTADRVFAFPSEQGIRESYRLDGQWPDWQYSTPSPDQLGGFTMGDSGKVPLVYFAENSFSPWIFGAAFIQGGDPGDESTIASVFTTQNDPSWSVCSVEGKFMGEPFDLWAPPDQPSVSGTIEIKGEIWWGYDGIFDEATGQQLIFPTPTGF